LAVAATIATNTVLSESRATLQNSNVRTQTGSVVLDARNTSTIDATTLSAATSGGNSVGVLAAFNTIGWKPQNMLFNALDTILGDPLISGGLDGNRPATV